MNLLVAAPCSNLISALELQRSAAQQWLLKPYPPCSAAVNSCCLQDPAGAAWGHQQRDERLLALAPSRAITQVGTGAVSAYRGAQWLKEHPPHSLLLGSDPVDQAALGKPLCCRSLLGDRSVFKHAGSSEQCLPQRTGLAVRWLCW